jgi:NSS family neurotransmitter:Na+ symporter
VTAGTFRSAIAQAFFSLSIGMGTMLTYGSYLDKTERIPSAALMVVLIDCSVAVLAGLVVLPAVFAYGLNPGEGPGLTFVTLPAVFAAMPFGALFGVLFFTLLAIAALTSAISLLEPMIAYFVDERGVSRKRAVWTMSAICFALGIPASLSFGAMSGMKLFGFNWFDLMDFLANTIMLPVGGLLLAIFIGWFWSKPALAALSNQGTLHQPWAPLWMFVLRFVAPVGIAWILLSGLL